MTNFTVGPTPLQIIGQGLANNPLTVQNTGAVSVYISADPGVSPNAFEYKIDAGGDFIWPSGKALSVCTGPGVIGQISYGGSGTVHVNSGSTNVTGAVTINGSVPISGPVTVSGSVALNAGSTVAIAGPVAIAGTVPISGNVNIAGGTVALSGPVAISGGVSVTGSIINIGTPIKLANNLTLITSIPLLFTLGTTTIPSQPLLDVSAYSSIILRIVSVSGGQNTAVATNYIEAFLELCDAAGVASDYYNPQWMACTSGVAFPQSVQLPVTSTRLFLNIVLNMPTIYPYNGNYVFNVYGSGEVLTVPRYVSQGDGMAGKIPQGGLMAGNLLSPQTAIFATKLGVASVNFSSNSGTVQSQLVLRAINNGLSVDVYSQLPTLANAGSSGVPNSVIFPMRPMLYAVSGGAGLNASLSITQ